MDVRRPTVLDLRMSLVNGRVYIRHDHPHPAADHDPIGVILQGIDGDWAWTTDTTNVDAVTDWETADTQQEAGTALLNDYLCEWEHATGMDIDWEHWGMRPSYGRGAVA